MEKSHHEAKAAYQRHTQHSGTHGKSALLQTFEHWYRIIGHRLRNKDVLDNEPVVNTDEIEGEIQARLKGTLLLVLLHIGLNGGPPAPG